MNEVQEAALVETNLLALDPDPDAEDVLQAIRGYSDDAVSIALQRTAGSGGGGGGIDFGNNSGTDLTITTTAGDVEVDSAAAINLTTDNGSLLHINNTPGDVLLEATDELTLQADTGGVVLRSNNGDMSVSANGALELSAGDALVLYSTTLGFYGNYPGVAQQTGVGVDAASIHAALVALGLITA